MVDVKPQAKRKRSPSYPYINLQQAVDLMRRFYEVEGSRFTPVSVALEHMDYRATSGSGVRVLATLMQFGLLEAEGTRENKRVRVSELGLTILEAPDEDTRLSAIQEAALTPDIHDQLWHRWDLADNPLPSDSTMRFVLLKEYGFQKNAVDSFIDEFKDTYAFAQLDRESQQPADQVPNREFISERPNVVPQRSAVSPAGGYVPGGMKEHTIQLIGQPMARLLLPHPLSERNLEHLINWLRLMGPALTVPEDDEYDPSDQADDVLPF